MTHQNKKQGVTVHTIDIFFSRRAREGGIHLKASFSVASISKSLLPPPSYFTTLYHYFSTRQQHFFLSQHPVVVEVHEALGEVPVRRQREQVEGQQGQERVEEGAGAVQDVQGTGEEKK